jgi:adenine-specific DNA methylase
MEYRKKLIEVALPLEAINKEAALEKSIRHWHLSTLHLSLVQRPLPRGAALPATKMSKRTLRILIADSAAVSAESAIENDRNEP